MAGMQERRRSHRVHAKLSAKVSLPREDGSGLAAAIETINISASGLYFKSDHFIAPMTKLALDLDLPVGVADDGEVADTATVSCEGLVVRVVPESETADADEYEIAVFFTHIEPPGVQALEDHISLVMAIE